MNILLCSRLRQMTRFFCTDFEFCSDLKKCLADFPWDRFQLTQNIAHCWNYERIVLWTPHFYKQKQNSDRSRKNMVITQKKKELISKNKVWVTPPAGRWLVFEQGLVAEGIWIIFVAMTSSLGTVKYFIKVHIFWEGHKILQNLHLTFDCMYCSQK